MPATVEYLRDNRVALFKYQSPLTSGELLSVFQDYESVCRQATKPLHGIGDVTELKSLPSRVLSILRSDQKSPLQQPMAGSFVIVTRNAFIKAMVHATMRLMPQTKIHLVEDIDQAWEMIDQILDKEKSLVY
jgi:hypothetical protein